MGIISNIRNDRQRSEPSFPRFFGDWQSVSTMTVTLFGKTTVQNETIVPKTNAKRSSVFVAEASSLRPFFQFFVGKPRRRLVARRFRLTETDNLWGRAPSADPLEFEVPAEQRSGCDRRSRQLQRNEKKVSNTNELESSLIRKFKILRSVIS